MRQNSDGEVHLNREWVFVNCYQISEGWLKILNYQTANNLRAAKLYCHARARLHPDIKGKFLDSAGFLSKSVLEPQIMFETKA